MNGAGFFDFWWPIVWILGAFLIVELVAALNRSKGDTLSEWVWKVYIFPKQMNPRYARFIFGGFWGALTLHFFLSTSVIPVILFGVLAVIPPLQYYQKVK